jgi:hypothetical protein
MVSNATIGMVWMLPNTSVFSPMPCTHTQASAAPAHNTASGSRALARSAPITIRAVMARTASVRSSPTMPVVDQADSTKLCGGKVRHIPCAFAYSTNPSSQPP